MVKELNNVVLGVKFTKASVRANILSEENNETLADSLGKIQKWYEDFKPVVWSGDADTVNGHVVNVDVPADAKFTIGSYNPNASITAPIQTNSTKILELVILVFIINI